MQKRLNIITFISLPRLGYNIYIRIVLTNISMGNIKYIIHINYLHVNLDINQIIFERTEIATLNQIKMILRSVMQANCLAHWQYIYRNYCLVHWKSGY